jgi:hypothetical protein
MGYSDADWDAYVERQRAGREKRLRAKAVRVMPLPPWYGRVPAGFCRWCGKATAPPRRYWHAACVSEYFLARNPANRVDVLEKSGFRCARCSVQLSRWAKVAECDAGDRISFWRGDEVSDGPFTRVRLEHGSWQADHVVPLWSLSESLTWRQRLAYFLLPNLQALCVPCHKGKCADEARQRADLRRCARQPLLAVL